MKFNISTNNGTSAEARSEELFQGELESVYCRRSLVFSRLMIVQWIFAIGLAIFYSPLGWEGKVSHTHLHVYFAVFIGAALTLPAVVLAHFRPSWIVTRHTIAASQMLWSGLLIHLTGGRIETHFHVFGSLAYIAYYRDWTLLLTATVTVSVEHLLRGLTWPESVYGVPNPEWWRFLEHAFWVVFEDVVLLFGIRENIREMREHADRQTSVELLNTSIEMKVTERTRELEASREQYRSLIESTQSIPWKWDLRSQRFTYVGPYAGTVLGCSSQEWLDPDFIKKRVSPDDERMLLARLSGSYVNSRTESEFRLRRNDGTWAWFRTVGENGNISSSEQLCGLLFDVTEVRHMAGELQQAQKLEAVGRLAAGVAHEINTPVQFVSDSVHFVRDAVKDMFGLLDKLQIVQHSVQAHTDATEAAALAAETAENADLPYLTDNVPKALDRALDGLDRVATIVRSMKEFAHPDSTQKVSVDLNRAIQSTLTIARNEYKYVADVVTCYGEIPQVLCYAGELNQAILNIIVNAAHAVESVVKGTGNKGKIRIATVVDGDHVMISVSDTGCGIPEEIKMRVFDPFFTTKEVGRGTGQGLAIARSVIVEKHGGKLTFESKIGVGTEFFIHIPMNQVPHEVEVVVR
ncbi:MAG: PAS domain-containing protein [Planctomycetes bacterium]|nr:PAS domain-containing protein [Planctomycetota bacterium]